MRNLHDDLADDEEAFYWAGDEVGGREGARLPRGKAPDGVAGPPAEDVDPDHTPRPGPGGRVLTGAFGLVYLALTVGWILGVQFTGSGSTDLTTEILWQFGEFTAIVAAPLWFGAALTLTRGGRLLTRAGWLALGAGLLVPWPLLPLLGPYLVPILAAVSA
jgi:hypothetical protein